MMGNFRSTTHSLGTTTLGGLVSILGSCMSLDSLGSFVLQVSYCGMNFQSYFLVSYISLYLELPCQLWYGRKGLISAVWLCYV